MNVNCIVTMGLVPEIKYLVSCILYLVYVMLSTIMDKYMHNERIFQDEH